MYPMRRPVIAILAILAIGLARVSGREAGLFDFEALPEPGQSYTMARFRMHVPGTPGAVRGVYFYVDPQGCDSRYIVQDAHMLGLCYELRFALMGAQLDNMYMESGIGEAVHRALAAFADSSGHTELATSTLFLEGYSWGGQFSYHFTKWDPERVIGFITQKGGYHDTTDAGAAILVPGYMFIGELDLPYRITNLTGIFEHHRPLGARWILAMQPGAAHERITDRGLLDPYVRTVSALRLPATITPGEPVELAVIPESLSWLGDRGTFWIGDYACFVHERERASWCPSRATAVGWQGFVSDSTVTDTVACPGAVPDLPWPGERGGPQDGLALCAWPNPSRAAITFACATPGSGMAQLVIRGADGRVVRRISGALHDAGLATITWDGLDRRGRPVCAGLYYACLEYACLEHAGMTTAIPILRIGRP
jgi:hypothetical protein